MSEPSLISKHITPAWRSFLTATWLGWQIESNWADPFLFAVYSIVKPLAGAGILVIMYMMISGTNFNTPIFAYLFLGNAFYQYVGAVMTGTAWAVVDDREHYKTLKYIYVAPVKIPFYLMGRSVSRFITCTFAVIFTVGFGIIFLKMPLPFAQIDWLLFSASMVVGILMLSFMGLILAGITLLLAKHSDYFGDAVATGLFLFTGAIFPLDVLPAFLRPIGYALPVTYWLELVRRSLVGSVAGAFPTLSAFSSWQIFAILSAATVVTGIVSVFIFRYCDHHARELGYIDRTTNY